MEPSRLAARTLDRLANEVGHTGKTRHYTTNVAMAMKYLVDSGMTIDFKADSQEQRDLGCRNIWMWIAYNMGLDHHGAIITRPSIVQRCESAGMHWKTVCHSIKSCRQHLIDDHQVAVLLVPRWAERKNIEVITIDPNYMVNESESAFQVAMKYGRKKLRSNIRRCIEHYERMTGGRGEITEIIKTYVDELQNESLPQAMLQFPDQEEVA